MDQQDNNIATIFNAGAALASTQHSVSAPSSFVALPDNYTVHSLERLKLMPDRKTGTAVMFDADGFMAYFNKHKNEDSQIYGQLNPPVFRGIMNDHGENPSWRDFGVKYECPISNEWNVWTRSDKRTMKQSEFAEFIENNLPDIVDPAGADMLEISRSLQAKKKVNFASGIRLHNGQTELTYEEDIQGTAAKGKLQIPETFVLGIQVLQGGDPYKVEARLRYRITDEKVLLMWYELIRPHKILEDAVNAVWVQIEEGTDRKIFNGTI